VASLFYFVLARMSSKQRDFVLSDAAEYVEEACFYLAENKVSDTEIAKSFNLTPEQVKQAILSYRRKIARKKATFNEDTKDFWAKNFQESSGDERVTLVDDKGRYYHGWKSELANLSSEKIVELLVINKQYSDRHPLSEFSKGQAVIGYDPIVPLRNIRHTVSILEELLRKKEEKEEDTSVSSTENSNKKHSRSKRTGL
jgi:hypothetical protein